MRGEMPSVFALATLQFRFQNQSRLPRRLVPNTFAHASDARRLARRPLGRGQTPRGLFSAAGVATGLGTMTNEPNITIGERLGWGDPQPFGIAAVDARQHIYIIGKTGSGKTTLLHNMILQHMALGHGLGLID